MSRNPTCIFDALEQLQYAMIVSQNSLFAHRQEINMQSKLCPHASESVTTCRQAIAIKESLQLKIAMLERADCKVTRLSDQEMVTSIIDIFRCCWKTQQTDVSNDSDLDSSHGYHDQTLTHDYHDQTLTHVTLLSRSAARR